MDPVRQSHDGDTIISGDTLRLGAAPITSGMIDIDCLRHQRNDLYSVINGIVTILAVDNARDLLGCDRDAPKTPSTTLSIC